MQFGVLTFVDWCAGTIAQDGKVAMCGAPGDLIERISMLERELTHYWSYFDLGGIPKAMAVRRVELFAREVIPGVVEASGGEPQGPDPEATRAR